MREKILEQLMENRDEKYKAFNSKIVPGIDKTRVIGVRVPILRGIAKDIAKHDYRVYIDELPHDCMYEERMIHGMILGYAKIKWEDWEDLVYGFTEYIGDWATCDSCAMGMKIIRKNADDGWVFLQNMLGSSKPFEVRFAIVMMLAHYVNTRNDKYIDQILSLMEKIDTDQYYIMMAAAWNLSECYLKFPEKTIKVLEGGRLMPELKKKSIQKICESRRVTRDEKERLKALK